MMNLSSPLAIKLNLYSGYRNIKKQSSVTSNDSKSKKDRDRKSKDDRSRDGSEEKLLEELSKQSQSEKPLQNIEEVLKKTASY